MTHPLDALALCPLCNQVAVQRYNGTQVLAPDVLGLDSPDMHEAVFAACGACGSTHTKPGAARRDLDGEAHGWIVDRRPRTDPPPARATVRPPAFAAAAVPA